MMMKEKRSFLEKLTGARKIDEPENDHSTPPLYIEEDKDTHISMNTSMNQPYEMEPKPAPQLPDQQWNSAPNQQDGEGQLTIDVYQTESDIVIKSTIAGVKPEDLDVAINNDMITIKGDRRNEEDVSQDNFYYQECYWGSFSRSIVLPVDVISEKSEASLKNGILTIRLPKAETNKTKRIQVRGF